MHLSLPSWTQSVGLAQSSGPGAIGGLVPTDRWALRRCVSDAVPGGAYAAGTKTAPREERAANRQRADSILPLLLQIIYWEVLLRSRFLLKLIQHIFPAHSLRLRHLPSSFLHLRGGFIGQGLRQGQGAGRKEGWAGFWDTGTQPGRRSAPTLPSVSEQKPSDVGHGCQVDPALRFHFVSCVAWWSRPEHQEAQRESLCS